MGGACSRGKATQIVPQNDVSPAQHSVPPNSFAGVSTDAVVDTYLKANEVPKSEQEAKSVAVSLAAKEVKKMKQCDVQTQKLIEDQFESAIRERSSLSSSVEEFSTPMDTDTPSTSVEAATATHTTQNGSHEASALDDDDFNNEKYDKRKPSLSIEVQRQAAVAAPATSTPNGETPNTATKILSAVSLTSPDVVAPNPAIQQVKSAAAPSSQSPGLVDIPVRRVRQHSESMAPAKLQRNEQDLEVQELEDESPVKKPRRDAPPTTTATKTSAAQSKNSNSASKAAGSKSSNNSPNEEEEGKVPKVLPPLSARTLPKVPTPVDLFNNKVLRSCEPQPLKPIPRAPRRNSHS